MREEGKKNIPCEADNVCKSMPCTAGNVQHNHSVERKYQLSGERTGECLEGECLEDVCHSHIQQQKSRFLDEDTCVTQEHIETTLMVVFTKTSYKITK